MLKKQYFTHPLVWLMVVFVLTSIILLPALNAYFVADDFEFLTYGKTLMTDEFSITDIGFIFSHNQIGNNVGGSYRPLTVLSLVVDYLIFKDNASGFHLHNLILHLLNLALLFVFVWLIFKDHPRRNLFACVSAGLFAFFHFHAEVITWVAARADLLATTFSLCSLILWVYWIRNKKLRHGAIGLLFFSSPFLQKRPLFFSRVFLS